MWAVRGERAAGLREGMAERRVRAPNARGEKRLAGV